MTEKAVSVRPRLSRAELLQQVRELIVEECGHKLEDVREKASLVVDLGIDSLDWVELIMAAEEKFQVSIPDTPPQGEPILQQVFTRPNFSVGDFVDLILLLWDSPPREAGGTLWKSKPPGEATANLAAFTQRDGRYVRSAGEALDDLMDAPNAAGLPVRRRRADGMTCVRIPACDDVVLVAGTSEVPTFWIDVEPVSATAYARFLNSIGDIDDETAQLWFELPDWDKRWDHQLLEKCNDGSGPWRAKPGAETWPMMLVSWFGANAYALWANRGDWRKFTEESPYLPSLGQFEYAARGKDRQRYPWGDAEPTAELANVARMAFRKTYRLGELPLSPVHEPLGLSPFGLRHMAGNVWHWCRDWRDPETQKVRCEKGGSWVGPGELARCDYHRGRVPVAKGRCLGFRCVRPDGTPT